MPPDGQPAVWITEDVAPVARNIYRVTKVTLRERTAQNVRA
jgi:hypothetical protein